MAITKAVWKFMFRKHSLRIAALMCCAVSATAAAMDRGQFQNVPPEIRDWFENMRSPKGISCCSYADGHRTGYDIRQGQYWATGSDNYYTFRVKRIQRQIDEEICAHDDQSQGANEVDRSAHWSHRSPSGQRQMLVYRHSPIFYLNPMSAVCDDVTNCDAGFD
jgi:hypothetical protein